MVFLVQVRRICAQAGMQAFTSLIIRVRRGLEVRLLIRLYGGVSTTTRDIGVRFGVGRIGVIDKEKKGEISSDFWTSNHHLLYQFSGLR